MFLLGNKTQGIYNAGFENISILDIAKKITEHVPAKIESSESNDPRSYRLNSRKLLGTGFQSKYNVNDGIQDVIQAYRKGVLKNKNNYYNIKMMKTLLQYYEINFIIFVN